MFIISFTSPANNKDNIDTVDYADMSLQARGEYITRWN
jgi:hypothetical protein